MNYLKSKTTLVFVFILFFIPSSSFSQTIYNTVGQWCDTFIGGGGSNECANCLSHPDQVMQNANSAKTKPRMLYVNDFGLFLSPNKTTSGGVHNPDFYTKTIESILGDFKKEKDLLDYACSAGFDGLILYNVSTILKRGDGHFGDNPGSLTWPQQLAKFMIVAKQMYGLEIDINAPDPDNGGTGAMWSNMSNFYDLTALGNGDVDYINAFIQTEIPKCNSSWLIGGTGSGAGGYFAAGDFPLAYPIDNEGKYHPFDLSVVDIMNIGKFKYEFARGMIDETWWNRIWEELEEDLGRLQNSNGSYTGCENGMANEVWFVCQICHSYDNIVSEYEFWRNENHPLIPYTPYTSQQDGVTITHEVYDIEPGYKEALALLEMIQCVSDQLETDLVQFGYSCPTEAHTYIIQLASASVFTNGKYPDPTSGPAKHYVIGSDWLASSSTSVENYNFDASSRTMANDIDALTERVYIASYRKTPCHLWSDDAEHNNQSYGRRFKDVYAYFDYNQTTTEIYPLFSARHYTFDLDFDITTLQGVYRRHLGLYLSHSGQFANANGFTGSLGGAEDIFTEFANSPLIGCSTTAINSNFTMSAPTTTPQTQSMFTGQIVELTNVVAENLYEIEGLKETSVGSNIYTTSTDKITIHYGSITGPVIAFSDGDFIFKPRKNGTYYLLLKKSTCTVHNTPSNYPRKIEITNKGQYGFPTVDPNPDVITEYTNNLHSGYAWFRYTDVGGIWSTFTPVTSWVFYKSQETDVTETPQELAKENDLIKIYPNPVTNGLLNIETENLEKVELFDMQGRLVYQQEKGNSINISKLTSGLYQVQVTSKEGVFVSLIVKK